MEDQYCPVHNIKCDELKGLNKDVKGKVPIWVFVIFVTTMASIIGYQLTMLNVHIKRSNQIFNTVSHGLNEVAMNQKSVMHKLEMTFQKLPDYD